MAKKESTELKEVAAGALVAPAGMSFEDDAGQGFENADRDSYALPFLRVIQSNSPQINPTKGEYIEGAQQGMMFETIGNTLFPGSTGLNVVPVHFERTFAEFDLREKGGGFKGSMSPEEASRIPLTYDDKNRAITPRGTQLVDTRNHYVLMIIDGIVKPAVVNFASTQIKKSRRWMTLMDSIKLQRADGSFYTPPVFSHVYHLTTVPESNEKGSWFGMKIENVGMLTDPVIYAHAKKLRESIKAGQVKAAPMEREPGADDDDIPGFD